MHIFINQRKVFRKNFNFKRPKEKLTTDNGFTIFIVRGENGYGDNKVLVGLESRFKPGDCFKATKQNVCEEKVFSALKTKIKTYDR